MSDRVNYRDVLRKNSTKTKLVVSCFLVLYCLVGFIIDIFFQWPTLAKSYPEYRTFIGLLNAIKDFQIIPYATAIMVVVGIISILVTFKMHDKMMLWGTDYHEITEENKKTDIQSHMLLNVIEELRIAGNLGYIPKVYIIEANYMNAFASGYSEKSAMVAITRGLIDKLTRSELQAVMAHEISHIKHMDIKLTLLVGVLANVMLITLDGIFDIARFTTGSNKDSNANNAKLLILFLVLAMRIIFPMLATILKFSLSRTREYMADAGAVKLTRDRESMASALLKIHNDYGLNEYEDKGVGVRQAAYIYNPIQSLFGDLFSTHPSIESRIKTLGMKSLLKKESMEK
jgi:heat shock protein HtpX